MDVKNNILLRKRAIIETINDELKNIESAVHTIYRTVNKFIINILENVSVCNFFIKTNIKFRKK